MRRLGDLTWTTVEGLPTRDMILIVPIGSTEQHGPHLPLSTDTDITEALVGALARERGDLLVAPTVPFGASGEHQGFPGTLSIGLDATELLLVELARSATEFVDHVLIVSAHGGNREAIESALALLQAEGRDVMAWSPCSWPGDAHAGHAETSIQLLLRPQQVLDHAPPGNRAPLAALMDDLRRIGVRAVSPNGILGDPTGASAETGREILRALSSDLIAAVEAWKPAPAVG